MKYLKLFEEYKVDNINKQDIINVIENDGKIKVSSIRDYPEHNKDNYVTPVDIDDDNIIIEVDDKQYDTSLEFVTKIKYFNINENIISDIERELLLDSADGFNNKLDAEKHLDYFLNYELRDIDNIIRLFRVVFIESNGIINTEDLGRHWTNYEFDSDDIDIIRRTMDSNGKPYIIVADFNKQDIDIIHTLKNQMMYPHENEFYIKEDVNPIKYKIYKFSYIENEDLKKQKEIWQGTL